MGAKFGTLVHAVLETADPFSDDLAAELEAQIRDPFGVVPGGCAGGRPCRRDDPHARHAAGPTGRRPDAAADQVFRDRLRELDFEFPLAGGDVRKAPEIRLSEVGLLLRTHLPADDPLASYADRLIGDALGGQSLRGYLSGFGRRGVADRRGGQRYLVVDYKTNWLGDPDRPLTAADYNPPRLVAAMLHSDYPLQALLYSVVLHRFLRWRQPDYDPARHLGGVLYLFLRGMCGPDTPVVDGHPAGVFSWAPPATLVTALSDLLDVGTGRPHDDRKRGGAGRSGSSSDIATESAAQPDAAIELIDPADRRQAVSASGLLRTFNEAGVIEAADVHVAQRLTAMVGRIGSVSAAGGRVGGARTTRAVRCASTFGWSRSRSASRTCRGRRWTSGWRPCGAAHWSDRRRCCGSTTTICCIWTGTGARSSRSPTTCWLC